MKISLVKKLFLSLALGVFATSCSSTVNDPTGISKAAGDAAVDAATEKTSPVTGAAVRQVTGYGTDPAAQATSGVLNKIGL